MEQLQKLIVKQFETILVYTKAVMVSRHKTSIQEITVTEVTGLTHLCLTDGTIISFEADKVRIEEAETTLTLNF